MALFVCADVPQALLDILNMIDFSKISEEDLAAKLQLLEQHAAKHLKYKQSYTRTGETSKKRVASDVPQAALDVINKFDFSHVSRTQIFMYKPLFTVWVRNNLPVRS